ncbi:MAG: type 4a pilus biogenesis protein PilO [bacterium]
MNFQNMDSKQKMMMLAGIAVFTLAASGFGIYSFQVKKIKVLKNRISGVESKIVEVSRARDNIAKFENELKAIRTRLVQVNAKLPREKELPELLGKLANLAASFPTKDYVSVVPAETLDLGSYMKLPIGINLTCTYENLQEYLRSLETLPRLVKMESIQVDPSGENPAILVVTFDISVYYLK